MFGTYLSDIKIYVCLIVFDYNFLYGIMKHILLFYLLILCPFIFAGERFSVADIFTDHMVLQRNTNVKIWGEAIDGTSVEVSFDGHIRKTSVENGKWMITLKTGEAGGPYELVVKNGDDNIRFSDVFLGDVWLAGGQSNMEFALRRVKDAKTEISRANYPLIRYYKAPRKFYEGHEVPGSAWKVCSSETASEFSAVAYYFARNLYKDLNIPIGIVQIPVGGTTVEAWVSRELLISDKDFSPLILKYDSVAESYVQGEYEKIYDCYQGFLSEYNKLTIEKKKYITKPAEPMGKWNFRRPSGLFYTMLKPVAPYSLKGFIFYQGESNTARGAQYRKLFPAMIKEWRNLWGQGDIPFLFVQLPRFDTKTRYWNELREAQYLTSINVKNTGMAIAFDQGNPKDIHPIIKDTVGWRLSQLALGKVYGKNIVYKGPEFKKKRRTKDGALLLDFANTGSGIISKNGAASLSGFMVAGKDGAFYPAEAVIVGESCVKVMSKHVKTPLNVRYQWVNSGEMNFFNKEGFPALPFRTDNYRLETENVYVNPEPVIPELDLFLFIGQSNMAGRGYITGNYSGGIKDVYLLNYSGTMEPARNPLNKYSTIRKSLEIQGVGPAYSFSKSIVSRTGHKLGIVVNARGGSSINSWLKGAKDNYYGEAVTRMRKAMKYGKLKAIIWHQGESDSKDVNSYIEKLKKMVTDLRTDLGNEKLPFIVGELAEWRKNGTSKAFNDMLRTISKHIPYSYCISSGELVPLIDENDPHFSADSQIILGRRYADVAYRVCYLNE